MDNASAPTTDDDVLVEFYPDAESMMEAEAQAIHDEQPPLNADGIG